MDSTLVDTDVSIMKQPIFSSRLNFLVRHFQQKMFLEVIYLEIQNKKLR